MFTDDSLMIRFYSFEQRILLKSLKIISANNIKTKFLLEIEENGSLSFLDITITHENNTFLTSVYCKLTDSGIFANFESFIPDMHKRRLIEILLHRISRLCSRYENFHQEIETLKSIFKNNNYPKNFVNQCIRKFLNKLFIKKDLNFMVPERELMFVLPHLGKLSLAGWPFHTGNTGIYWTFILFILENILENGIFPSIYWKNSGILLF